MPCKKLSLPQASFPKLATLVGSQAGLHGYMNGVSMFYCRAISRRFAVFLRNFESTLHSVVDDGQGSHAALGTSHYITADSNETK